MIEVIYWSGTGNTEAMANALVAGIKEAGEEAHLTEVDAATPAQVENAEKIAFGCSAMGDEVLEEGSFEPFFASIEGSLKGKKVALFEMCIRDRPSTLSPASCPQDQGRYSKRSTTALGVTTPLPRSFSPMTVSPFLA